MSTPSLAVAEDLPPRTDTVDHYLETIFCIAAEGEVVRPSRLAEWLQVSPPTVSVALRRLARDGWVTIATNRSVTLTQTGEAAAADMVRRHRILERWLTDVLQLDWATADVEANRLAGSVSDEVLRRLDDTMEHPSTCPHGNPIPGRTPPYGELIALSDLEPHTNARVQRISEIAEHDAVSLLRELGNLGVHTGTEVSVVEDAGSHDSMSIAVNGNTVSIATAIAHLIWVEL